MTGAGYIDEQQGPTGTPLTGGVGRRVEDEASPSTLPHSSDNGREWPASIPPPEHLKRHHPGTGDTSTGNHPSEEDTQDDPCPQKRQRLEQDGEPGKVSAPEPSQPESSKGGGGGRSGKGSKGGRGGARTKKSSTRPVGGQGEHRRSTRNSGNICEFLPNLFLLPSITHCLHKLDRMCTMCMYHQGFAVQPTYSRSTLGVIDMYKLFRNLIILISLGWIHYKAITRLGVPWNGYRKVDTTIIDLGHCNCE
jgi:hypothetical protein